VFPTDPRAAIARMPYVVDCEPRDRLLVVGFDAAGAVRHRGRFRLDTPRPLDDPLLDSSLWSDEIQFAAAVAYSDQPRVDLRPLVDAWGYRGRTAITAAWAGLSHWRSYLCNAEDCCGGSPHPYNGYLSRHDRFEPLYDSTAPLSTWRRARWDDWRDAIARADADAAVAPLRLELLSRTLYDIPVRDAVLAHSADPQAAAQAALTELLRQMSRRSILGTAIPAHTCLAAMHYLADDLQHARHLVRGILQVEEYSLARLLHNGLEMRAPASLLARSFAHFNPHELLAA